MAHTGSRPGHQKWRFFKVGGCLRKLGAHITTDFEGGMFRPTYVARVAFLPCLIAVPVIKTSIPRVMSISYLGGNHTEICKQTCTSHFLGDLEVIPYRRGAPRPSFSLEAYLQQRAALSPLRTIFFSKGSLSFARIRSMGETGRGTSTGQNICATGGFSFCDLIGQRQLRAGGCCIGRC